MNISICARLVSSDVMCLSKCLCMCELPTANWQVDARCCANHIPFWWSCCCCWLVFVRLVVVAVDDRINREQTDVSDFTYVRWTDEGEFIDFSFLWPLQAINVSPPKNRRQQWTATKSSHRIQLDCIELCIEDGDWSERGMGERLNKKWIEIVSGDQK